MKDLLNKANKIMRDVNSTTRNVKDTKRNLSSFGNQSGRSSGAKTAISDQSWVCTCKSKNTSNFCENCGSPKPVCPNCGDYESALAKAKFCAKCGAALNQ
ncbi:MAG: hypothetical protein FWF82_04605 [Oscillospiraceae bacterium]|nr:hypothetical protein [Oscillospiraceae bacterium]